jgi:hypothetical protein
VLAWNKRKNLQSWLTMLKDMLMQDLHEWNLSIFTVDNADAKTNTIR